MYKIEYGRNPETHCYNDWIFVKDEQGNTMNWAFDTQESAFDYIKELEGDTKYRDFIENPGHHIQEIYDRLDSYDKVLIQKSLVQKYRSKCMWKYFKEEEN